jgi:hypothetical protein
MGKGNHKCKINDKQAIALGLNLNPSGQYRLTPEQRQQLKDIRYNWVEDVETATNINKEDIKHGWRKVDGHSVFYKNPLFTEKGQDEFAQSLIESLKDHAPNYQTIKRDYQSEGHLLVIDPADIHIGKLATSFETGEEYNSQIAVQRVKEGVQGILEKANGFNIDKILFVGGNDILHIDTPKRTTTSGTNQDTCGMWYDNFLIAKKLYVEVLEQLIQVANVHFVFNPSNHDYTNGFFLADVIQTHFRNCNNITFDCSIAHRKYYAYGKNLIGTTHGDGAKQQDLGSLMSIEAKDLWAFAEHRYYYTHHVHHKTAKDYINVTVESLRSPSGSDSWHDRNGYKGAPKAVEGYIHHKDFGQIARLTHIF